jgi:hypothetical protein
MDQLRLKALSGLLLCGSLMMACTSSPDAPATTTATNNVASNVSATITAANNVALNENRPSALQGFSMCAEAMCWTGIIPGVTTFETAKSIIEAIYPQDAIKISRQYMSWIPQISDSLSSGSLRADNDNITMDVDIGIPAESVPMSEMVEWIGEPDLVNVVRAFSSEARCAGSLVIYSDPGIMVFLYPENKTIGISPTQFVSTITLIHPEIIKNQKMTDTWELEWQGYTDYCAITEGLD